MIDRDNLIIHTIKRHFNEMNATLERINDSYDEFIEDLPMRKAIYLDILQIEENFNHLSGEILKKIDKKDIKTVVHLAPSTTAEAYIQEAGRGGRDGSIAKAILIWSLEDSLHFSSFKD